MNIVELRAQNFARLTAVSIRPSGPLVQVTGKNSNGKTSVLNAIWTALKGRAAAPPTPVHKGAEEARILLDLGEMKVLRTFKPDRSGGFTTDLKVMMADGSRVGVKPQAMIDAMLGDLSFDPLAFARLPPAQQFERVRQLVPGFDFARNASQRKAAFDDRTVENRRAKDARARAAGIQLPPGPRPKATDVTEIMARLTAATARNAENARDRAARDAAFDDAMRLMDQAEQMRARAAALDAQAAEKHELASKPVPDDVDTSALTAEVKAADTARAYAAKFDERDRHEAEAAEAEAAAADLTERIEALDRARHQAVAGARMPVSGLAFGDEEVLLNGLPFSQAGTAEKIRTSVAIGMALNPRIKVMLVDEGSELDSDSLAVVAGLAEAQGHQVWVARVAEGDAAKAGFEIVDGSNAEEAR